MKAVINDTLFKLELLSLEDIRTNPELNPFPIGVRALFYLLKNQRLSLKGQVKLIEHFGLSWELKIIEDIYNG
jgi:hypothetical protein